MKRGSTVHPAGRRAPSGPDGAPGGLWLNQDVRMSMELVSLGRLVLIMHLTLIGYAIGYFQNQDPHGYPDLLI